MCTSKWALSIFVQDLIMNFYPKAFEAVKRYIMKAVGYLYNKVDVYQIIFIISVFDQGGFRK